jgi:hypothetical protein
MASQVERPFSPEQLYLVELRAPHVKQAFRLHAKLTTLRAETEAFHFAFDATAVAVVALRSDGGILAASQPAQLMLSRREILVQRSGSYTP